ncbi:uncharacterized protein LOC121806501 isoform X1 [Salvia splendens]|uniref:uncharacterized protein LOC121806501 isoform X1 n=2 Tax=Salvia splendens TaxID=180675 RepID=UPI001C26F7CE|nr:uncharacterized protein LOC121806501 isoform X1 [Salvia splendens]
MAKGTPSSSVLAYLFPIENATMNGRRATSSTGAPAPSLKDAQSKLFRIVCHHEQLKVSFEQLRSQIGAGLLEAEDVFVSLAIQLMKLVGLKTTEMAEERRFSTIVSSFDSSQPQTVQVWTRRKVQIHPEDYMEKAMKAGNELMERQKLQIIHIIGILQNIEDQVNSSKKSIVQDLAECQSFISKLFRKASSVVSSAHQSGRSNDLAQVTQKVLKYTFNQVGLALGSVEVGVEDIITGLADQMCNPMCQYVHGLKAEMKTGACSYLLETVKEMHEVMQVRRLELEEAKSQTRYAEQSRIEALSMLTQSEETAKELMMSLRLLSDDRTGLEQEAVKVREDQAKDDGLMWELLRQKGPSPSDSPLGPNELQGIGTSSKRLPSKRVNSMLIQSYRAPKRPQIKRNDSTINTKMILSSSPSATTQNVPTYTRVNSLINTN